MKGVSENREWQVTRMTKEDRETLESAIDDVREVAHICKELPEVQRAIAATRAFMAVRKIQAVLAGEAEAK